MPAAPNSRRQLTLFVAEPWRSRLNGFRQTLDPVQASLISAHVTLAREDEIGLLDPQSLFKRVASWSHGPISLAFGQPQRFFEHGVLLPCEQGQERFLQLRQWLLQDQGARAHEAHLTLAHPRNPRSLGNTEVALSALPRSIQLQFASVSLIEQIGTSPWRVLQESNLRVSTASGA